MARRRHSNRRRHRGSFSFLYKVLSILLVCAVIVVALTLFFRVNLILVEGEQRYTEDEVRKATQVETGDNLFLMNKYEVANNILSALPYVEEIRINRKLPDTMVVEVRECGEPLAIVQEGYVWLISPAGKIVDQKAPGEEEGYLTVDGCQLLAPTVGTPMALATEYASQQQSLLDLIAALESANMIDQATAIHMEDLAFVTMDYAGRFRVEIPYGADYPRKLRALQAVIDNLETNQTGTVQLTWDNGEVHFIED